MTEIEVILYWTLLCVSIGLTATGIGWSLVIRRKRRGFSEKTIIKETKKKEPSETPGLFGALQRYVPSSLRLSEEEKASALPPPPEPVCEECGSESSDLKPLVLAVAGTETMTKKVCPNCLKRLTMRHVI